MYEFGSIGKDSLIQPNRVTNAIYSYTAIQENILTCIIGSIQKHMTRKSPVETSLFGQPIVRVSAKQIGTNKTKILRELTNLRKKDIRYSSSDQEGDIDIETGLVSGFGDIKDTDYIDIHLSAYSIPYLIYWGSKGFTTFSRTLALTLKSKYTKRIYKMLKQWEDKGAIPSINIEKFRETLQTPKSYDRNTILEEKVLIPAKKELDERGDITFEYLITKERPKLYEIKIKILSSSSKKEEDNTSNWYSFVYRFLCFVYPKYKSDKALTITDKIQEKRIMRKVYLRFSKLDDQLSNGEKKSEDIIKMTKHILKTDYDIKP